MSGPCILGALRVKNEQRWIGRVVHAMQKVCFHVIVFDDHSTDATRALALAAGAIVLPSPFEGFDETRDKNWLLEWLLAGKVMPKPGWILWVDGDELLEEAAVPLILSNVRQRDTGSSSLDAFGLEVVYLWNDEQHVRTDLRTFCRSRASLFRALPGTRFQTIYPKTGLHCGNVPYGYAHTVIAGARLLHFGYMLREDRLRKHAWYNQIDPDNAFEDHYRHMIIGDTNDLPASIVTKWGGPLRLERL